MTYTQTPVGTNGVLNIAQGVNSENNVWFSWKQLGTNNIRKKITHVELFGDQAALQTALGQHKALGVQFTVLDDYNKRRLIHQLAQYTTLKPQGARSAGATDEYGLPLIETLSLDGRLLDVKNAKAVIVNEHVSPTSASQLIGEVLIALPAVENSRNGSPNFDLDDTLFLRVPVNAAASDELWKIGIVQNALPPPLDQPKVWIPVASFSFSPQQPRFGQTIQFDASASSDVDGEVVDYIWAFGDGTTSQGQASVSHLYAQPGSYQASLTVVDNDGQSSTPATVTVTVAALLHPVASFTYSPTQPTTGQAVQFNGSASSDSDGTVVSYNWTFGDGSTAQGQSTLSHTYATAGSYQASLTVVDNDGQSSTPATVTITVVVPGPPAGQLRVRITEPATNATLFQIQVVGYSSWTPRHNFKIDMLMSTNEVLDQYGNPTTNTSGFTSATAAVTGDAAATLTQALAAGPHLEGAVGTGTVTYSIGIVSNVDYVRFTIRLDMDGDGIYEVGPTPVPIYVTVGTDTRRVVPTGTVTEFMLRKNTGTLLAFVMSNLRVCSSTGTNCVVLNASAAASDMMGSAANGWSSAIVSTNSESNHSTSAGGTVHALNDPIILDPEILDYWKTDLAVPTAIDLATMTVKEVTRDNFYNNYTTEKIDALDIRAFARWGRDFEETFTYCPYVYYDELAPFKRVLCTGYWDNWYERQWDKGVVTKAALKTHDVNVDSNVYDMIYAKDSNFQSDFVFAGVPDKMDSTTLVNFENTATQAVNGQITAQQSSFSSADTDAAHLLVDFFNKVNNIPNAIDMMYQFADAIQNNQFDQVYSNLSSPQLTALEDAILAMLGIQDRSIAKQYIQGWAKFYITLKPLTQNTAEHIKAVLDDMKYKLSIFFAPAEMGVNLIPLTAALEKVKPFIEKIVGELGFQTPSELVTGFISDTNSVNEFLAAFKNTLNLSDQDLTDFADSTQSIINYVWKKEILSIGSTAPVGDYAIAVYNLYARTKELYNYMGWLKTYQTQDGPENQLATDRLQEGVGTILAISNAIGRGWAFKGLVNDKNFLYNLGQHSTWWGAMLYLPASLNAIAHRNLALVLRGDNCGLTSTVGTTAVLSCSEKSSEIVAWVWDALNQYGKQECSVIPIFGCSAKGVITVALTNPSSGDPIHSPGNDIADAIRNSPGIGQSEAPIIVAWKSAGGIVSFKCASEGCTSITIAEQAMIACSVFGLGPNCMGSSSPDLGGGLGSTPNTVVITPAPRPSLVNCATQNVSCLTPNQYD